MKWWIKLLIAVVFGVLIILLPGFLQFLVMVPIIYYALGSVTGLFSPKGNNGNGRQGAFATAQ